MRILIDTNVVLDALMAREPWAKAAQNIMLAVAEDRAEGCITASSFTDLYYLLNKHFQDKAQTKQVLIGLLMSLRVLDVNSIDCEKAFDLPMPDYEDALLAYCGKRHGVEWIITRNTKHFTGSPVKAISPEEFLEKL